MSAEIVRLAVGLPLAAAVAGLLPGVREAWWARLLVAAPLLALALLPGDPPAGAWIAAGVLLAIVTARENGLRVLLAAASGTALTAVLLTDDALTGDVLADLAADNRALIVVAGFTAATLVGGELVAAVAGRFAPPEQPGGVLGAGRTIGWLERSIVFTLVLVAKPEAAALVLTAKSLARLPELGKDRQFTEYFLIGTLTSVAIAGACAVATRAALGLTVDLL